MTAPTPYLDLVRWLIDRRYADSVGRAMILINSGYVKYESHKLHDRFVPSHFRKHIRVEVPKDA